MSIPTARFLSEYARHRAEEGRGVRGDELRALPYLRKGPLARQWAVRARSYETFVKRIVQPMATRPLLILDIGAGNGWLCYRMARSGHRAVALDIRDDDVDGLGAARDLLVDSPAQFQCVKASFEALPFADQSFDVAIFNASLHYATRLGSVLMEAARIMRPRGLIVILDSPFYACENDGERMVAEKFAQGAARFGARAEVLLSPRFIEFLTRERLQNAVASLSWSRLRVRYPLWYEMRPLLARLKGGRRPSRFDVWSARVS
jgi:ubiquinone/menaquinone biosynthesis C-methylase UbiE